MLNRYKAFVSISRGCYSKIFLHISRESLYGQAICHLSTTDCVYKKHSKWIAPYFKELKKRHDVMVEKELVPQDRRSTYTDWNHEAELYAFGQRLGERFDSSLLLRAMVDPSHLRHVAEKEKSMETLLEEGQQYHFTGDSPSNAAMAAEGHLLIKQYCTNFVRKSWPHVPSEGIVAVVDYLSSDDILSKVAQGFGLKDLLFAEPYPPSDKVMANGARAVVSALKASSGQERAELFVVDFVASHMVGKSLWDMWQIDNPVLVLQEIMAQSGAGDIEPRLVNKAGVTTLEAVYRVAYYVGENKTHIGTGYGETVTIATKEAALDALARLFGATAARPVIPFDLSLPPSYSKFRHPFAQEQQHEPKPLSRYTIKDSSNVILC